MFTLDGVCCAGAESIVGVFIVNGKILAAVSRRLSNSFPWRHWTFEGS